MCVGGDRGQGTGAGATFLGGIVSQYVIVGDGLEEIGRCILFGYHPFGIRHRQEDLCLSLLRRLEAEYGRHVAASIAIVWRRPHRHQLALKHILDALVHQLMRPTDQIQIVNCHKVLGDIMTKQPASSARTLAPVFHVLGIGPYQIAEGTLVRYLTVAFYGPDLVEGDDLGTQAAVNAQNLFVDNLKMKRNIIRSLSKA